MKKQNYFLSIGRKMALSIRDIYRIGLDGKNKVRLSSKVGTSAATFSPNFQYFITTFSSATQPPVYTFKMMPKLESNCK